MKTLQHTSLATRLAFSTYIGAQTNKPKVGQNSVAPGEQVAAVIIELEQRDAAAAKIHDIETLVSL